MGREYEGIYRVSYLIDEKGIIEKAYEKVKPKEHAAQVYRTLTKKKPSIHYFQKQLH